MPNDRIHIEYHLTFETPFHCGTGIRVGLIDRSIIRDRDGYLYVPGSTFKGVLREHCEQLARFYTLNEDQQQLITSPHDEEAALRGLGRAIPMTTRIFGSHNHPGQLFFNDARQEATTQYDSPNRNESDAKGKYKELQVQVSTQVRLDRPTRTAIKGALYTSEFGARDVTFKGEITGWLECSTMPIPQTLTSDTDTEDVSDTTATVPGDKPTYSLLLLLGGLMMIERLGGNKSTGKGYCTYTISQVRINETRYKHEEWLKWLEHLHMLTSYPASVS